MPCGLLLRRVDTGACVLEGVPEVAWGGEGTPAPAADVLYREDADPQDLERQRWGVILPEGADRRWEALAPLIALRAAEQGDRPVLRHVVPSSMDAGAVDRWVRDHARAGATLGHEVPLYWLVVGDLDEVPLALQQALAAGSAVGRLALDADGLAAYAGKLVAAEAASEPARAGARLHVADDGSAAIEVGARLLVDPGRAMLERAWGDGGLDVAGVGSARDAVGLRDALREPSVALFSLAHGAGGGRSGWDDATRRALQGAPLLGDGTPLRAAELGAGPVLPGGFWFLYTCFGAGTPASSGYAPWVRTLVADGRLDPVEAAGLAPAGGRPFVAALPRAVLAHPEGPLGVLGHVDLAWTYAFEDQEEVSPVARPGRVMEAFAAVAEGGRFGLAARTLARSAQAVGEAILERAGVAPASLAPLHMLRQDLRSFILLGDPAARVRRRRAAPAARTRGSLLGR